MDPRLIFMLLVFATVFSFGQAVWGMVGQRNVRRAVNKRLATAERAGSLGELVLELRKQRGFTEDGRSIFSWGWFADLVIRSGVHVDARRWTLVVVGEFRATGLRPKCMDEMLRRGIRYDTANFDPGRPLA